ncbi:MAG TPA: putative Ig domain-containing protein, partial [Acidimicrobiia bacterium]|nr:putative Ig domain-containing protein [Acidimicrobiia bacterium]
GLPDGLSIDPVTGEVSGTITYDASPSSPYSVTVTVTDDDVASLSSSVSFSWDVANTNRAPVVEMPADPALAEGSTVDTTIVAVDPDGDTLTWTATGLPDGLMIDSATGRITGVLDFSSAGTYPITVTVAEDGSPAFIETVEFTWAASDTNRAPLVTVPDSVSVQEGAEIVVLVGAEDPDGDGVRFTATGMPPGSAIDPLTGQISGVPGFFSAGSYTIEVTATDDGSPSLATTATFVLTIGNVNLPPRLVTPDDRADRESTEVEIVFGATDPDGDALRWSASGLPEGVLMNANTGVLSGRPVQAGTYTVVITVSDGVDAATATFGWRITEPGVPVFEALPWQTSTHGDTVEFQVSAAHPVGYAMTFTASGLPPGVVINSVSGLVSGVIEAEGTFDVVITATDERGRTGIVSFPWVVEPNDPPVARMDRVSLQRDTLVGPVTAVIDILGNDEDPEGLELVLRSIEPPPFGVAELVDGSIVYRSPDGFTGTLSFAYSVVDPAGNEATATIEITVHEPLVQRLAIDGLAWTPDETGSFDVTSLDTSAGTQLVLGTVVQSLHVLRVPLGLLGGAVLWSLLLGGAVNVGFLGRLLPGLRRRRHGKRYLAIVMAPQGARVSAQEHPGTGAVLHRFLATDRRIEATGRVTHDPEGDWTEVLTPKGAGWVPARNVTEHVDRSGFREDSMPTEVLEGFIAALRVRGDLRPYVSPLGLSISHHGPLAHYPHDRLGTLLDEDREVRVWKGRNPAFPDFEGTFDFAVATSVLDAWDRPQRELLLDGASVPSTVVPVEFTNFHAISIGADLQGRDRLEQTAWLVFFDYVGGEPTIIGLCREG